MPKRLTPQAKISRLHDQGFSDAQVARVTGFSKSSVGRIRRGQQSGERIAAPLGEFFKLGKRARQNVVSGAIPLPSAKPAPAPKAKPSTIERIVTPLERAEGQLTQFGGDTMVVVQLTSKSTGKSRTLFARGGVEVGELRGRLKQAIEEQAEKQGGNRNSESPREIDWDDIPNITIEEY